MMFLEFMIVFGMLASSAAAEQEGPESLRDPSIIATRVAIQGVCAWPNLQRLRDGTLIATIFNQPCHGLWEGDLDCWASVDGGRTWRFRSRPAEHKPGTNRMNCAVGFGKNGDLIVLSSGYGSRGPAYSTSGSRKLLGAWVCRSSDGGHTWSVSHDFPDPPATPLGTGNHYIPFGNILPAADGSLCASVYLKRDDQRACYLLRSRDDGRTWGEAVVLNPTGNETAIVHLGNGRWLAASREFRQRPDVHLQLFTSEDDGRTWQRKGPLTMPMQVTGHLTRLNDGRILLSYGNRNWNNFGVDVRFSDDEGQSWGPPIRIANTPYADCGYPSTIQLPDGNLVTAYYTQTSGDFHYEMRIATWNPDAFATSGVPVGPR